MSLTSPPKETEISNSLNSSETKDHQNINLINETTKSHDQERQPLSEISNTLNEPLSPSLAKKLPQCQKIEIDEGKKSIDKCEERREKHEE